MKIYIIPIAVFFMAVILFAGCEVPGGQNPDPVNPGDPQIAVTGITLDKSKTTILRGAAEQLSASVIPANASNKKVSWTTSSMSIARVDSSGMVSAINSGTATITATTDDGSFTDSCIVTVNTVPVTVTGVTLGNSAMTINKGDNVRLIATIIPSNATNQALTWFSDNRDVATVTSVGVVTAVNPGSAKITVTTVDGLFQASCTIGVTSLLPQHAAQSISFVDTDYDYNQLQGILTIGRAQNETDVTHYVLYWGSDNKTKITPAIAQIAKTGSNVTHTFRDYTTIPAGATCFLVYTKNNHGEMETGISLPIRDLPVYGSFPGGYQNAYDAYDSIHIVDIDNDGDPDLVQSNNGGYGASDAFVFYYDNDGNANFTCHPIDAEFYGISSQQVVDLDNDGDLDIVSARSTSNNAIVWFENNGDNVFMRKTIAQNSSNSYFNKIDIADVDGDSDLDIVATGHSVVEWLENDGNENFTRHTILYKQNIQGMDVVAVDLDEDGDIDICTVYNYMHQVVWLENDGNESFSEHVFSQSLTSPQGITVSDYDDDGDLDILATGYYNIYIFENNGLESFSVVNLNRSYKLYGNYKVECVDVDGDGLKDIVTCCNVSDKVIFWHNTGTYFKYTELPSNYAYTDIAVAEIDNNGVNEIIGIAGGKLVWWKLK